MPYAPVVTSVENIRTTLHGIENPDQWTRDLLEAIESFTSDRLALS